MPESPAHPLPHDTLRSAGFLIRRNSQAQQTRLVGDLLMAIADDMADYPAVLVPNGVGIESQPNRPSAIWTAALKLAENMIGPPSDESAHV